MTAIRSCRPAPLRWRRICATLASVRHIKLGTHLEKQLVAPFSDIDSNLLEQARSSLVLRYGS